MFAGYFDESGTHGASVCVIAGFTASVDQLMHFEKEWKEALALSGVSVLHMKHLHSSRKQFIGWGHKRKEAFQQKLFGIIGRRINMMFAMAVRSNLYQEIIGAVPKRKHFFGSLYAMTAYCTLHLVKRWGDDYGRSDISLVFDQGHTNAGEVLRAFNTYKRHPANQRFGGGLSFADDSAVIPLQAADMLAWWFHRVLNGHARTFPEDLYSLPSFIGLAGREELEQMARLATERGLIK